MSSDGRSESAQAPLTVLIGDTPEFRDGRQRRVARSSADGVALLLEVHGQHIAHLWLDHDLGGDDDIWPVVRLLEDAHLQGSPFDIGLVHIQASRSSPAHRIGLSLRRAGYPPERPTTRACGHAGTAVPTSGSSRCPVRGWCSTKTSCGPCTR